MAGWGPKVIPINGTGGGGPSTTPIFEELTANMTSLNYQMIFTFTVTQPSTRLLRMYCTAETTSDFQLVLNGDVIGIKRSSPMERNVLFDFYQPRQLMLNDVLEVRGRPERMFRAAYESFVAMEGFY